jgi:hypothetical protein
MILARAPTSGQKMASNAPKKPKMTKAKKDGR